MLSKNPNSFNHQVFQKSYKRLNLSPTNRIIFQRLLGFLIRNNKPFPYSAVSLSQLTGFSLRTIFNSLNDLENLRLIKRVGMGKNRKFIPGTILIKIFATVQNRTNKVLNNNATTVQLTTQKITNRARGAYRKTSYYLKHKEKGFLLDTEIKLKYQEYYGYTKDMIKWGKFPIDTKLMTFEEFIDSISG